MDMWKKLEIESKEVIDAYTKHRFHICDFVFSNLFLWSRGETIEYQEMENVLCLRGYYNDRIYYFMPIPKEETEENIAAMKRRIESILEEKAPICYIPEYWWERLKEEYILEEARDSFDYVYQVEDLAFLKGRRFAKKKNHISKFKRNYPDFSFEEITQENLEEVKKFQSQWCFCRECEKEEVLRNENIGILSLLDHFETLELKGSVLKVNGEIVGFSLGEALDEEYVLIHVEKAIADYPGSYQILNSLFLQQHFLEYRYVNREDDFGDEGLREAKESYHPVFLLKKYNLISKR